jgi:hypothetical protein
MSKYLLTAACAVATAMPLTISAQTSSRPPEAPVSREQPNVPAMTGERTAVPMGGGGRREGAAASTGSVDILSNELKPRFREYAIREQKQGFRLQTDLRVGTVVPESVAQLQEIPAEYGVGQYRYTVLNHKPVLVDPNTRQIVEVVE